VCKGARRVWLQSSDSLQIVGIRSTPCCHVAASAARKRHDAVAITAFSVPSLASPRHSCSLSTPGGARCACKTRRHAKRLVTGESYRE
jgi:hypothetical protein